MLISAVITGIGGGFIKLPRVILADDHRIVVEAFSTLLRTHCDVVATVSNAIQSSTIASPLPCAIELNFSNVQHIHPASAPEVNMRRLLIPLLVLSCFSCMGCNVKASKTYSVWAVAKNPLPSSSIPKRKASSLLPPNNSPSPLPVPLTRPLRWSIGGTNCSTQDCGSISAADFTPLPRPFRIPLSSKSLRRPMPIRGFRLCCRYIIAAPSLPMPCFAAPTLSYSPARTPKALFPSVALSKPMVPAQLLNGKISLCRSESHCFEQAFAGATSSTDANNGTFAADIFPASTFIFSPATNNVFKLDLTGSHNLRASGILYPNTTSADN